MKNNSAYTKEEIINRMFSRMSALWGIRDIDNLDPVVRLLAESLAAEIFQLSGEINDLEKRIVDKLAISFTPSVMLAASPASAIAYARALKDDIILSQKTVFQYNVEKTKEQSHPECLNFTPLRKTTVINGDIINIVSNGHVYKISPKSGKEAIARSIETSPIFTHSMWFAIDLANENANYSFQGMTFYFDFPLTHHNDEYFKLLKYSKWSIDGLELTTKPGFCDDCQSDSDNMLYQYNSLTQLQKSIAEKYAKRFIHIEDKINAQDIKRQGFPQELTGLYPDTFISQFDQSLIWIKLNFHRHSLNV